MFYVSLLRKYVGDTSFVAPLESVGVKEILTYENVPIKILVRQVRKLRTKEVACSKNAFEKLRSQRYCLGD